MPTSDKEQIHMVKDWWKRYGAAVLIAVLVFAATNFGWRYWQRYKHARIGRASNNYMQMLVAFGQQKNDEAKLYVKHLMQDDSTFAYASLAALMQAKIAVQAGDLKLAQEQLQFVIKKSSNDTLCQLARIRLARVFLATKQPQEALNLLATVNDDAYQAEISEISGDAFLALGRVFEAKQSYQKAKDMTAKGAKSPLLQLKMQQF
jgi:predicted negative regulator of RcsB-dependent stress response